MYSLDDLRATLTTAPIDVSVGAVTIAAYLVTHSIKKKTNEINLANIITVFSSAFSILPGASVMLAGFVKTNLGIEQSYFFIGGFAVIYIGIQEIVKKFKAIDQAT